MTHVDVGVTSKDCDIESRRYLDELGMRIVERRQRIQFNRNNNIPIHRWSPYILGFSQPFVFSYLNKVQRHSDRHLHVHDPFAGCGTVLVEAKKSPLWTSSGTELNPLLAYITRVKLEASQVDAVQLWDAYENLRLSHPSDYPTFLDNERQFNPGVLYNIRLLKGAISHVEDKKLRDLLSVAFSAILTECSKLRRTPSLGYDTTKEVPPDKPLALFRNKVKEICEDLNNIKTAYPSFLNNEAWIRVADAREFEPPETDLVITSPPYMNGFDYVTNFKIEMAWLDFTSSQQEAKSIKDAMIACDNISKGVTRQFASIDESAYHDEWLDEILARLKSNIANWGEQHKSLRIQRKRNGAPLVGYRRTDMPYVVHKYFDDMSMVMRKVTSALAPNGVAVFVVGDSFIADTYIPTDLLLANIGRKYGLELESIERARVRHSGQIRDFKLRETITTFRKIPSA